MPYVLTLIPFTSSFFIQFAQQQLVGVALMLILALACGTTLGKKLDKRCVNCTYRTYYTYGDGRSQQRVIYQDPYYTRGIYSFWDSQLTDDTPIEPSAAPVHRRPKRRLWSIAWVIVNPSPLPHTHTHILTYTLAHTNPASHSHAQIPVLIANWFIDLPYRTFTPLAPPTRLPRPPFSCSRPDIRLQR